MDRNRLGDGLALVDWGQRGLGGYDLIVDDVVVFLRLCVRLRYEREVGLDELGNRYWSIGLQRAGGRNCRECRREELRQATGLLGEILGDLEVGESFAVFAGVRVGGRSVVVRERAKVLGFGLS